MRSVISTLVAGAVAFGAASAFAADKPASGEVNHRPWMKTHPAYEAKAPMDFTCKEFVDIDEVYQPYVVAWLSGHHHKKAEATEVFVPVSVPMVIEECKTHPAKAVSEVVEPMAGHHKDS